MKILDEMLKEKIILNIAKMLLEYTRPVNK